MTGNGPLHARIKAASKVAARKTCVFIETPKEKTIAKYPSSLICR